MIVKMRKVHIVARRQDRDRLLDILAKFGVLHLTPLDPDQAIADEKTITDIGRLQRAAQILTELTPAGAAPDLSPEKAAAETLHLQRDEAELTHRLVALHHEIESLSLWGDVEIKQFDQLRDQGVNVQFFSVPTADISLVRAQCVEPLTSLTGKRSLLAVIDRTDQLSLPPGAEPVPLPPRDRPTLRAEAAQITKTLQQNSDRLAQLAHLRDALVQQLNERHNQADFTVAARGGLVDQNLFALQGWLPDSKVNELAPTLEQADMPAALQSFDPAPDDNPPTLIRYPAWARPIQGLFDMLGTVGGYREFDVSAPFMIALPIFAAMLIGDGGYGAVLFFGLLLFYKKMSTVLGPRFTQLLIIVGGVALLWGGLCGSFFGFLLYNPPIPVNMTDESRFLMMKISFTMGAIHLSVAQLWQAVRFFPDLRFLNKLGWAIFVWGMLAVVKMFVLNATLNWQTPWPYCLISGAALAILFASPSRNIFKMLALGLADFPLSMLSTFSDVISYVRLMAVGLASGVLASSFNELALGSGSWLIAAPTLLFGHGLNLGLAMIALFAHGVRLNMLEFSNNLGMQWTGYSYKPFTKRIIQET